MSIREINWDLVKEEIQKMEEQPKAKPLKQKTMKLRGISFKLHSGYEWVKHFLDYDFGYIGSGYFVSYDEKHITMIDEDSENPKPTIIGERV